MLVMDNLNRLQNSEQNTIFINRKKLWRRQGVNKNKRLFTPRFQKKLIFLFSLSKVYIYIGTQCCVQLC